MQKYTVKGFNIIKLNYTEKSCLNVPPKKFYIEKAHAKFYEIALYFMFKVITKNIIKIPSRLYI